MRHRELAHLRRDAVSTQQIREIVPEGVEGQRRRLRAIDIGRADRRDAGAVEVAPEMLPLGRAGEDPHAISEVLALPPQRRDDPRGQVDGVLTTVLLGACRDVDVGPGIVELDPLPPHLRERAAAKPREGRDGVERPSVFLAPVASRRFDQPIDLFVGGTDARPAPRHAGPRNSVDRIVGRSGADPLNVPVIDDPLSKAAERVALLVPRLGAVACVLGGSQNLPYRLRCDVARSMPSTALRCIAKQRDRSLAIQIAHALKAQRITELIDERWQVRLTDFRFGKA